MAFLGDLDVMRIVEIVATDRERFREPYQVWLTAALRRARSGDVPRELDRALARFLRNHPDELPLWGRLLYGDDVDRFRRDVDDLTLE